MDGILPVRCKTQDNQSDSPKKLTIYNIYKSKISKFKYKCARFSVDLSLLLLLGGLYNKPETQHITHTCIAKAKDERTYNTF